MIEKCKSCRHLLDDNYCTYRGHYLDELDNTDCDIDVTYDNWITQDNNTFKCANCQYDSVAMFKHCPECNISMTNGTVENKQPTPFFLRQLSHAENKRLFYCEACDWYFIANADSGKVVNTYCCPKCKNTSNTILIY